MSALSKEKWWLELAIGDYINKSVAFRDRTFSSKRKGFAIIATVFASVSALVLYNKKNTKRPVRTQREKNETLEEGKSRIDGHFLRVRQLHTLLTVKAFMASFKNFYTFSFWSRVTIHCRPRFRHCRTSNG